MSKFRTIALLLMAITVVLLFNAPFSNAQETTLSNNVGDESAVFFISGESTLVMNGFDLNPLGIARPAVITRASIAVDTPVVGTPVEVVVYQDGNGGSPQDATLAGRTQVNIDQPGTFTVEFPTPVLITEPVVWVGFYLPPDFRFLADQQGSSVLTYWAWTPGTTFSLSRLSNPEVFGPADGSAPVSIDQGGVARITAVISTEEDQVTVATTASEFDDGDIGITAPLDVLKSYPDAGCETLYRDTADSQISYRDGLVSRCQNIWQGYAPESPTGFNREQLLYDVVFFEDYGLVEGPLRIPVTHCIEPNPADRDLELAVGVAASGSQGTPSWQILESVRLNDLVCAELTAGGLISYFIVGEDEDNDIFIEPEQPATETPVEGVDETIEEDDADCVEDADDDDDDTCDELRQNVDEDDDDCFEDADEDDDNDCDDFGDDDDDDNIDEDDGDCAEDNDEDDDNDCDLLKSDVEEDDGDCTEDNDEDDDDRCDDFDD